MMFAGNYHGYYTKRPLVHDPRLALLPPSFFTAKHVLDVGCNDGLVTCDIALTRGAHRVLGVDIDDTLVRAAWKRRRTLWSLLAPTHTDPDPDHFPLSCQHTHGPLPIPAPRDDRDVDRTAFPHNVAFRTADFVTEDAAADAPIYDIVVAFSVTKWIHLQHGDPGITAFFRRAHHVLKPGGAFVVEPQPWDTYAKARRMDPQLKENARQLQLRPHDFPALLADIGFGSPQHLGTAGEGGFHRPVDLYIKQ